MDKAFIYGKSVAGENFTDRVAETKRLKTTRPTFSNWHGTCSLKPLKKPRKRISTTVSRLCWLSAVGYSNSRDKVSAHTR